MQTNSTNPSSPSNSRSGAITPPGEVLRIDCSNPQTQQDLNLCAEQAYQAADQEMRTLYQQMQGQVGDTARSQLDTSQAEWVESRAAECRLEAKLHEGGSLYPTVLYRCMERMTRDRMKQLQEDGAQK